MSDKVDGLPPHWRTNGILLIVTFSLCLKLLLVPSYVSTDFDVHRNWMAITNSLPLSKWYYEDTSEWTLDYPPFFAYFEWALSQLAPIDIDPDLLDIRPDPYRSWTTLLYQRLTVIASDIVLVLAALYYTSTLRTDKQKLIVFAVIILNAGLLMLDHIHFQYNGMLLGLLLFSITCLQKGRHITGSILFAICLHFKHINLYCAPAYFTYLLSHYCQPHGRFSFSRFVALGLSVASIFVFSLGPFLFHGVDQLAQILKRLFPFGRGLCHAYWAPNAWAIYNTVDRILARVLRVKNSETGTSPTSGLVQDIEHVVLPTITPSISLILVLLSLSPMLVLLYRRPSALKFKLSVALCSLSFFMFGWHVHEKAILMSIVPLYLVVVDDISLARITFFLTTVGHYSLFPVLYQSGEMMTKICLLLLHSIVCLLGFQQLHPSMRLSWLECLYLSGLVPLQLFVSCLQPAFLPQYPFLPLMFTSIYTSLGTISSYVAIYLRLFTLKE
ncbi:dolichyl glycosyltransferase [Planoprotostelium fungivorum]|uniref:Alpha-1,3-glucosyltransferase n=1 Tax=Planoprotostelium fungivorum TaxID=1890364 RepID=A0A2P6NKL1_9EUKA|nr:dolichyl glycosyltransferase [Planoprotostelium fungivorum]